MTLKDVQKTYEAYGKEDPLYAVLSRKDAKDNKWDVDEFFASGREEIAQALSHLSDLGVKINKGRAMDFGCGVGRLTQALCPGAVSELGSGRDLERFGNAFRQLDRRNSKYDGNCRRNRNAGSYVRARHRG